MPRSAYEISLIALARTLVLLAATSGAVAAQLPQPEPTEAVGAASPRLPVFFVENRGQWAGEARYAGNTAGYAVAFHDDRVVLTRAGEKGNATVELAFVGGRARPLGEDPLRARVSYFVGEASSWRSNLESCAAVRYRGLWPGVDLRFYESAGALEYDVILAPGAELAPVEFEVVGAAGLAVEADGALLLRTELGDLRQAAPRTWEVAEDGTQLRLRCDFEHRERTHYGFRAMGRDSKRPLVVDPVLVWGSYFGTSGFESCALTVDAAGCVYLAGATDGTLPTTPGVLQPLSGGSTDGFIAKLDPMQSGAMQLVWCTYLGGSYNDGMTAISMDSSQNLVVGGFTASTDFPTSAQALDTTLNNLQGSGALCVLSRDGSSLLYSTFLDGTPTPGGSIHVVGVAPETGGTIIVGCNTLVAGMPTTPGAYQSTINGTGGDVWLGRIDPFATGPAQLLCGTHFGSIGFERLASLAIDPSSPGVVTLCGSSGGLRATAFDYRTGTLGQVDAFLCRFDLTATGSSQRTWLHLIGTGANTWEYGLDLTITPQGELIALYLHRPAITPPYRCHAVRVSSDGSTIASNLALFDTQYSGTYGQIAQSCDGTITMLGIASGATVPVTLDAAQQAHGGGYDLWIAQASPDLSSLLYASYFGGGGDEQLRLNGVHMFENNLTFCCDTTSAGLSTANPLQPGFVGGLNDVFVARLELPYGRCGSSGIAPRDVELLDLDADGDLDVATANEGSDNLSLRTSDGADTLSAERTIALTAADDAPIALARCDLDDDGARDDLAVACAASSTIVLVTNPSSASPTRVSLGIAGQRASCVAAGDLDADPRDDVIVGREGLPLSGGAGLAVVRNGGAAVDLAIPAPHPTQIARVLLGDLDGDGDLDLAALARGGSDAVLLFAGDGAGALVFAGSLALTSSGLASSLVLADLDGDGRNDLAAVQPALFPPTQTLRVFRRSSAGPLSPALFTLGADLATSGTLALDLAVGDVEGDSIPTQLARLEFAHANAGDGSVTLRHGYTGSSFASSSSPTVGTNPVAVALGDLNGDGCDDLVVANQGSNDVSVLLSTPSPLAQSYGTSCGGPLLAAVGSPTLGNAAFAVELSGARAFSPVLFLFSSTSADIPLPPSACNLYLGAPLSSLLRFTNASGRSVLQVGIPNWPVLRGVDLYFQGAVFRSSGGAFDGALDLSDALRVQVGS